MALLLNLSGAQITTLSPTLFVKVQPGSFTMVLKGASIFGTKIGSLIAPSSPKRRF
jgi:hypothetical protein